MIARFKNILREYWVEIVLIPPFLVGLCYFFYGDAYLSSWRNIVLMTAPWLVTSILSPICCHWVRRTTLERFTRLEDWPKRVVWSILGYLFFTVGFAKATFFILSNIHYENLAPSEKNFTGLLIFSGMSVLIISTLYEGITYFEKWKSVLTENEQLEKLSLETQFQSLQSQLNPHFLFNSLNVLSSLIAENPRRAEDFVDELSNVYRYLLRANEYELVSVAEELRFIRSYFHLLETRHDTGIELKIKVSPAAQQQKLPALALQILLENAVKHNEISPEKPLSVEILEIPIPSENTRSSGLAHKILVRNNLQTKRSNAASNRVGLQNLRSRYELLGISGFEVEAKDGHFNVILPLI
jgi:hypothetical protein